MGIIPKKRFFPVILLLCAAACILQPVAAENGTITIAYRGSGGGYIGDTIVFDGKNTYSEAVLVKITGPGLPSEGVAVNNLNSAAGTTTTVPVDKYGAWRFAWYGSYVKGLDKLQTARYTFTATDSKDPGRTATTSLMLKKPEFFIRVSPNPSNPGDYIELAGTAEQGINSATIEIADASGKVLHSFTTPVGSSGYMSYGFHGDLVPGDYTVTVSNPSLKAPYRTTFSVVEPQGSQPVTTAMTPQQTPEVPATVVTVLTSMVPPQVPLPTTAAKTPVAAVTIVAALMAGIVLAGIFRHR